MYASGKHMSLYSKGITAFQNLWCDGASFFSAESLCTVATWKEDESMSEFHTALCREGPLNMYFCNQWIKAWFHIKLCMVGDSMRQITVEHFLG